MLSACEPYLLEGDPLAIVEVVGMAAHASVWIENAGIARGAILDRLIGAARDASAVERADLPAGRALAPRLPARPLGRRARRGDRVGRARARTPASSPLLAHALAALAHVEAGMGARGRLPPARDARAWSCRAVPGRGDRDLPARRARAARARARPHPRGDRGARGAPSADAAAAAAAVAACSCAPDLVEAYVRAGRRDEALALLERLERAQGARPARAWARAATARLPRAARARRRDARRASTRALALHDGLPMPFERARTLLALGERLRRAKQRADAREPLQEALDAFERLGARPWAERARGRAARDRRAAGRRARRDRGRAAHPARAADRRARLPGHDQPRGGSGALPHARRRSSTTSARSTASSTCAAGRSSRG